MANHLKMAECETILTLHRQGWSKRKIARELGVDRGTVRRTLRANQQPTAAAISKTPTPGEVLTGSEATPEANAATPGQVLTGSPCAKAASVSQRSKCEPYRQLIEQKLEEGLSAQRIFQDLLEEQRFEGSYHSVRRLVHRMRAGQALPFRRIECESGAEAQADFGKGAPIINADGKRRHSHVLRVVLSFSRKSYSEAFYKQDTESWLAGWENAFWAWGGVPKTLQMDNAKAAVKHADWYDPELHPIITSFCKHYGTVLLPIKARTPRHNGKAESNICYVKNNGLKGRTFQTLAAENEHLAKWESTIADKRIHGTTKQQVCKSFEIEKPALLPLPATHFQFFHEGKRIVHFDGHISVAHAYYSVPPEYLRHTVWVRWDSHLVRILNTQFVEIRLHARQEPGRFRTAPADISSKKIALVESGATALLSRVRLIGPQAARWAEVILKERSIIGVRVLVGLLALARRHSSPAVEQACELACEHGVYHLRQLLALLKEPVEQEQFEFMAEHPIIRNLHDYGTLVKVNFDGENAWQQPALKPPEQKQQNDGLIEGRLRNGTEPALN
jgi:transposase